MISAAVASISDNSATSDMAEQICIYSFLGIFALVGLGILVYPLINRHRKKKRCTYWVKATVVGFEYAYTPNITNNVSSPVYEFCYGGQIYKVKEASLRNFARPKLGSKVNILINEDDPTDFYTKSTIVELFLAVAGFIFLVSAVCAIIFR